MQIRLRFDGREWRANMLDEISHDGLSRSSAANQPMFSTDVDYDSLIAKKAKALEEWRSLDAVSQRMFCGLRGYEERHGIADLKDPLLIPAKNTLLLLKEVRGRIDREDPLSLLGIEPLDFDDASLELAESLENIAEIRELYKLRKTSVGASNNSGISADEAS